MSTEYEEKITEYKGFTIFQPSDKRFYIRWFGKFDGYATLNNAKGAITKHLQAEVWQAVRQTIADASELDHFDSLAIEDAIRDASDFESTLALFKWLNVHANLKAIKPVKQSRNKREGLYAGKYERKSYRISPYYSEVWCKGPNFVKVSIVRHGW